MAPENADFSSYQKQVLVVDDERGKILLPLKDEMNRQNGFFSFFFARKADRALEILAQKDISLLIADLEAPEIDGLELVSASLKAYPDIPVVIITGEGQEELEKNALEKGAAAVFNKPYRIRELSEKMFELVAIESSGGAMKGVSIGVFLQMVEMEKLSCTVRVLNRSAATRGILFFKEGRILDARFRDSTGEMAMYTILSWDSTDFEIQNSCPESVDSRIRKTAQTMLLEAMQMKDEELEPEPAHDAMQEAPDAVPETAAAADAPEDSDAPEQGPAQDPPETEKNPATGEPVIGALRETIGKDLGIRRIDETDGLKEAETALQAVGDIFQAGRLKYSYLGTKDGRAVIFLPGTPVNAVQVDYSFPRERIFRVMEDARKAGPS